MSMDRLNEDKFDETLSKALQRHSEPVPTGFTERILRQIEEAQKEAILARVVWQERFALAGCIVFGAFATVGLMFFPARIAKILKSIGANLTELGGGCIDRVVQTMPISIESIRSKWQFYIILVIALGFAIFSLLDMLVGDRLKIRIV